MAGGQRVSSSNIAGLIVVAVVAAAAANLMAVATAATTHTVGESTGWTIQPNDANFYSEWAASQTFAVGDTLVFNFRAQAHDVIEVPISSYNACSTSNQIGSTRTSSPASVSLNTPGVHYYICGFPQHCSMGQKLAITVASSPSTTGGSSVPPAASPSSPTGGKSPNAAPSSLSSAATVSFALLSLALYFLF